MVSNFSPDHDTQLNTEFLEQRSVNTQEAQHSNIMTLPVSIENEMADKQWFAKDQLMKPILIDQIEWDTSHTRGTLLGSFDFPEVITTTDSLMQRTLSIYTFFKMTPVFRFQLNSPQFNLGQLICSYDPFAQATDSLSTTVSDTRPLFNNYYATGMPNVKIMASESEPAELEIPFIHPRNFLTTNSSTGFDILGKVRVTVLNALQVAAGASTAVTLSVWLYAKDASVHVPIYYHDLKIPDYLQATSLLGDIGSDALGLLSNGANMIGNFYTGNWGQALRRGQGLIDNLGNMLGFDYPANPINSEKCISPIENLAVGKGVSRSQRMAIDPLSGHGTTSAESAKSSDEMNLMQIIKMPMMFENGITWNTSEPPGTLLSTIDVAPSYAGKNISTDENYAYFQPTYLEYVSSAFCYWRGGLTYDIEFVATRFHSGKLLVAFVPNAFDVEPTYSQLATACPNVIIDIQQTSSVSFTVPYVSPTPLKTTTALHEFAVDPFDELVLGKVYVYVQNRLTAPSNVPTSIDINLYVRAANDFELFVPRNASVDCFRHDIITPPSDEKLEATSGEIKIQTDRQSNSNQVTSAVLSAGQDTIKPRPRFGESYTLIDIIRRFTFMYNPALPSITTTPTIVNPSYSYLVSPVDFATQAESSQGLTTNYSYLKYFGNIFSAWSGSIRYKIVTTAPRTSNSQVTVIHLPSLVSKLATDFLAQAQNEADLQSRAAGLAMIRTNLAQDNALEIEVPFYSPYNLLLTRLPANITTDDDTRYPNFNGTLFAMYENNDDPETKAKSVRSYIYTAAGEDFKYYYLRAPPPFYLRVS